MRPAYALAMGLLVVAAACATDSSAGSADSEQRERLTAMARESRGAVVFMHSAPGHNGGSGVGFVFDPQGYILANAHVVDDIPKIEVVLIDGRRLRAHVVGMVEDKNPDVAVLRVEADSPLPALTFGDPPDSGDTVLAIGHPAMRAFWVPIAGTVVRVERQSVRVDMLSFFGMSGAPPGPPRTGSRAHIRNEGAASRSAHRNPVGAGPDVGAIRQAKTACFGRVGGRPEEGGRPYPGS